MLAIICTGVYDIEMKLCVVATLIAFLPAFAALAQNPGFRLVETVLVVDTDANGTADSIWTWSYAYDHRNLVRVLAEEDFNADGIKDHRSTATFSYDRHGNRISSEAESYSIAEGTVDQHSTTTYALCDGVGFRFAGNPVTM